MAKIKTIRVGRDEIIVDDATYAAANRDLERSKKKNQRLRRYGYDCAEKSLDEMYSETEFEPTAETDAAETAVDNVLAEQLWKAVNEALDKTDRFIVTAYYRDKLTENEIAAKIGISRQAVSKRRKKAEEQLKSALKKFENFF